MFTLHCITRIRRFVVCENANMIYGTVCVENCFLLSYIWVFRWLFSLCLGAGVFYFFSFRFGLFSQTNINILPFLRVCRWISFLIIILFFHFHFIFLVNPMCLCFTAGIIACVLQLLRVLRSSHRIQSHTSKTMLQTHTQNSNIYYITFRKRKRFVVFNFYVELFMHTKCATGRLVHIYTLVVCTLYGVPFFFHCSLSFIASFRPRMLVFRNLVFFLLHGKWWNGRVSFTTIYSHIWHNRS